MGITTTSRSKAHSAFTVMAIWLVILGVTMAGIEFCLHDPEISTSFVPRPLPYVQEYEAAIRPTIFEAKPPKPVYAEVWIPSGSVRAGNCPLCDE